MVIKQENGGLGSACKCPGLDGWSTYVENI